MAIDMETISRSELNRIARRLLLLGDLRRRPETDGLDKSRPPTS